MRNNNLNWCNEFVNDLYRRRYSCAFWIWVGVRIAEHRKNYFIWHRFAKNLLMLNMCCTLTLNVQTVPGRKYLTIHTSNNSFSQAAVYTIHSALYSSKFRHFENRIFSAGCVFLCVQLRAQFIDLFISFFPLCQCSVVVFQTIIKFTNTF